MKYSTVHKKQRASFQIFNFKSLYSYRKLDLVRMIWNATVFVNHLDMLSFGISGDKYVFFTSLKAEAR